MAPRQRRHPCGLHQHNQATMGLLFPSSNCASSVHGIASFMLLIMLIPAADGQAGGALPPGPITRPPQVGDKPIVANGIVYYLRTVPDHCIEPYVATYPSGGVVYGRRAMMKSDNPHIVSGNIEIPPDACLYIEPGVEIRFGPGFGIIVNGTLIARGSEEPGGRIVMTKNQGQDIGRPSGDYYDNARLTGGNTTRDGRLELMFKGKWRAICTNYQNFTLIDVNVTCRHLGFLKGNFTYHSFSRNLTDYMLWEKPDCRGTENSLFDCPGASKMQMGAHICDGQQVVGFECEGLRPGLALDHWRGLEFFNSTSHKVLHDDNVLIEESYSWLEYLDILYPGLDTFHGRTTELDIFYPKAAISASPLVPLMNNVTIMYGAYDAFNLTEITGNIHIANCTVRKNRGYGAFIQTAVGQTLINQTEVTENWGDGIKFYISNLTIHDFRKNFTWDTSFCRKPNLDSPIYPVFEHQDVIGPEGERNPQRRCQRWFSTTKRKSVNLHFLLMERDPEASGTITVTEGRFGTGALIGRYDVSNGSFPQSVRSRTGAITVIFEYQYPQLASGQHCKTFPPCLRFLLRVTTSNGTEDEFRLIYSKVSDNNGYGVNIQDIRSKVFINTTEVSGNQFGAGIRVYQGAGEVVINNTLVENNKDTGINITYSGGYQLLNNTRLIRNRGYGVITEYLRLNRTRIESMFLMEIVRGQFMFNDFIGLRVGNYCLGGAVLVNESRFSYNQDEAIEYLSCNISAPNPMNFSVAYTDFDSNIRHAILMKPLLNTVGIMTNCTFRNHSLGTFRIDNGYDLLISKWYRNFPVDYKIFDNRFYENYGRYVVSMRLTDETPLQKLLFKFNRLIDNVILDSFPYIKPRAQANAVAVVSSRNIKFIRNIIINRESVRELATHLVNPAVVIDASQNFWGYEIVRQSEFEPVHRSIFDQDDRYNLAQIKYYPALKTNQVYDDDQRVLTNDVSEYEWSFSRAGNTIGGVLRETFHGSEGTTYYVDRDIYVLPGYQIVLPRRVVMKFATAVGMVVHGCLKADGQNPDGTIRFELWEDPDILPLENRTASVRLVNGSDLYEGRLEVLVDDEWGTVCSDGWTEDAAALVCRQLGLIYNPDQGTASLKVVAPQDTRVLMSWVTCDEVDDDLTTCRAVRPPDITCGHDKDVYLRCQDPTWAGITVPATSRLSQNCESQIRDVHLERAGLLDAASMSFTPALRIDYNFYIITRLTVTNSLSDGIHINYNHPYETARLEYIQVHNNKGHGVVTRYPRLELLHSNITHSGKAGFQYDPFFGEYDALIVHSSIDKSRRSLIEETPTLDIGQGRMSFLLSSAGDAQENKDYYTEVRTDHPSYRIVLQMLDYFPVTDVEQIVVFDSSRQSITGLTKKWVIPDDLVDFPIMSAADVLTVRLSVRGLRSGRMAFAVLSQSYISGWPVLTTYVYNTTFSHNYQGMQTKHYNSPTNRRLELFHRFKLETIKFDRVNILNSKREAVHMPSVTKFTDDYIPTYEDMTVAERVATIRYNISLAKFADNEIGILAEHNHVDFANNVWQWLITDSHMVRNRNGGLFIEVPRVNDEVERKKHSVSVLESQFLDNSNFACTITGYYADVRVEGNLFDNNRCLVGLFTMSGMEKNLSFINNRIRNNVGRHMVDINILSHSEYSDSVKGIMRLNEILDNRYEGLDPPGFGNSPKTFAVSFRGVQDMVAKRNLFRNPQLGYELVAGITALSLMNPVDVTENFWGRTDYGGILDRIFDFDDWNNYVVANFFPYLTRADVNADLSGGEPVKPPLNTNELGGRVLENQILAYKTTPYIVQSDLTVMPDVTLTISPGVELQFRPNVGILVLGRLVAKGMEYNRIKMRPVQTQDSLVAGRKKRAASATIRLRGDGTLFKDSGFLEFYNASTKSWNMMCDNQFNEKSAEVVCRQLGKETINVRVRFTHLYDFYIYGEPQYFLKEFWFESYFCRGDEANLEQCVKRYNYNMQRCIKAANYTFVTCGERNLPPGQEYWGNIRFAARSYQEQPLEDDIGRQESILEYLDIEGAGILHGEKVGAIQTTYVTPKMNFINVTKCAENGFDVIAPRSILEMNRVNVTNNLGFGYNFLILNGESSSRDSSFSLLGESTIPYNVYGLVEICRMEKRIELNTRMILYYKYGPNNRDCVKIIRSTSVRGRIGLRFLQVNMFQEDFSRNVVEIFDGDEVNPDTLIMEVLANTSSAETAQLYQSTGDTLSVHIHASVSHGSYGFIAEVVTIPLSGLTYPDSTYQHSITQSIALGNQDGALQYKNVGEVNPSFYVEHCWLEDNGVAILNLTSPPVIDIALQGTLLFRFASNFVARNKGGMYLALHTNSIATALKGNITNNVFYFGTNGEALNITGHYYQKLYMFQNYIYNYSTGDYRDVVHIRDVVVNYTYNYLDNNTGHYILTAYNSNNRQARQEYTRSGFLHNNSTALLESTIKIGRGRPFFEHNYIVNDENDFEMETYPKLDPSDEAIDARNNWWGSDLRSYINGKLWDAFDQPELVRVEFWQPKLDNRSVVEGKCLPGWKLDSGRCYRFMGGALPYHEANRFCQSLGAFLAEGKGREGFYHYLLRLMRNLNDPASRVWVMSEVGTGRCTALAHTYLVPEEDCWNIMYPFICEKDPYLEPPAGLESSVSAMVIGIGAGIGGALLLVIIILGILWCVKSKRREKERFERTASLRSSVRSSMRGSKSTLTVLSEGRSRRRLHEIDGYSQTSSVAKVSQGTMEDLNGSMASLHSGFANGRAVATDRRGADQRGAERSGWQGRGNRWQERGEDREAPRPTRYQQRGFGRDQYRGQREQEQDLGQRSQEREMGRGRRYRPDEDDESYHGSRGKEASESEEEKKPLSDSDEEEEDSFDSDPEEQEAAPVSKSSEHLYQNRYQNQPFAGTADGPVRRARSRDDVYENEYVKQSPTKSKSLSSFSQPDSPDESPVKSIFLPPRLTPYNRREDLPTPPPTPEVLAGRPKPQPAPKPQPMTHPAVQQYRQSPVSSEASGGRPSPLPRKQVSGSQDGSPRATPPLGGVAMGYPSWQASPLPAKQPFGSQDSLSRRPPEAEEYKPRTPTIDPSQRLPNLPRYSPPLPMDNPPSYEESDTYPGHLGYPSDAVPPSPSYPVQEPPSQDVQYLQRQQPADRRQFYGSRDRLGGSQDRLDGRQDRFGGSRERLAFTGSRERLNSPAAAYSPGVLYLSGDGGSSRGNARQEHLETEI